MAGGGTRRRGERRLAVHRQVDSGLAELVPDLSRADSWILFLDGTPQSQVDLADPTYLEFEYVRRLAHIVDLAAPDGEPLRVLHLGGGGLTLPRYVAATRPGSAQLVAEADAALTELVRRHLPLPPATRQPAGRGGRLRIRIGDARQILETVRGGSFDVVICDVFAGARTPAHLTTVECASAAARALRPDGIYALNVADGAPLAHAREQVSTLRSVFPHCCMVAEPAVLRGRRFGNMILAGSSGLLPVSELSRRAAADPFPARVVCGADLAKFASGARPRADATAQPSPSAPENAFAAPSTRRHGTSPGVPRAL
ncbi:MAG TPA: fused MFS/spermidine synthase [Streptosporangiaceae bacterium]|nr:fused MFS/spermidine synthase [Streptosporangiaceae bacterium]